MRVLFSLTILLLSFNAMSNTDLDLGQRLALLTPGNEQKLAQFQKDIYTERFELAKMSRDISYQSWRDYYLSGDPELFNDALYWAEEFNAHLRYLVSHQLKGDLTELITLATIHRYEFIADFKGFINRPRIRENNSFFVLKKLDKIIEDFERLYHNDLKQPH